MIIPINACGTNSWNTHYFGKSQNQQWLNFLLSDTKFMNSLTIFYKKISECSMMFVECVICFDELEEAFFKINKVIIDATHSWDIS